MHAPQSEESDEGGEGDVRGGSAARQETASVGSETEGKTAAGAASEAEADREAGEAKAAAEPEPAATSGSDSGANGADVDDPSAKKPCLGAATTDTQMLSADCLRAAAIGDDSLLASLGSAGITGQDRKGNTVAHMAAKYGWEKCIDVVGRLAPRMLCARNKAGATPANYAALYAHERCLTAMAKFAESDDELKLSLLGRGDGSYNPNCQCCKGNGGTKHSASCICRTWRAALHCAAQKGHTACVRVLAGLGAHMNQLDARGNHAMHLAARNGHAECLAALLSANDALDTAIFELFFYTDDDGVEQGPFQSAQLEVQPPPPSAPSLCSTLRAPSSTLPPSRLSGRGRALPSAKQTLSYHRRGVTYT